MSGGIMQELRPCYVMGVKALFHMWIDKERFVVKFKASVSSNNREYIIDTFNATGILPSYCDTEKTTETLALIEYADGEVAEVRPTDIEFADNKMNEYSYK
jgi:hypothetical protein